MTLMQTERITLRHWQEPDADALFKYASDPDVGPMAGWPAHRSVDESREIIRTVFNNGNTWAIVWNATGYYTHDTSNICIGKNDCEVGYWLGKPFWNKGICTEALRLLTDYCIRVKHFGNIWADHFTGNPASGRVMQKCGFVDTGQLNRCSQLLGGDREMVRVFRYEGHPQQKNYDLTGLFERLARSSFRSRFHLTEKDKAYIADKGLPTIRRHAADFVARRLAPAVIPNDGRQTPMRGHPVFIAQHATGCCCRGCFCKWHHIPAGRQLTADEQQYAVAVLMAWIERQL